jgi:hypothetical protein
VQPFAQHGDGDDVRAHLNCESHSRNDLRRADPRCIELRLHSVVSHFALWLDFSLRLGALKLFDEVLVKQSAAKLHVR